jgi:hypothetical protein
MKRLLLLTALVPLAYSAQVGINIPSPASTLDITAKNPTGTATTVDGIVVPRVDRQRAQSMTGVPVSTLIYINDISTGTTTGTTEDVTAVGFYHFDGTKWIALITASSNNDWRTLGNVGTNSTNNFIGTTDNQNLVFKRNNADSGLLGTINTSFGVSSLPSTSAALLSTAYGISSLSAATTGSVANSAFGHQSLSANTTGAQNSAFGYQAMLNNTTGARITAIGSGALKASNGGDNVAVGYNALDVLAGTGTFNVALGTDALGTLTTGGSNTAIGDNTGNPAGGAGGAALTSGSGNILIGRASTFLTATANNQMNIGNAIFGNNLSNNISSLTANVGIGTANPTARLEIASGTTGTSGLKFTDINNATATTPNAAALGVDASGNVVIQNVAPLTTSFKSFSIDANSAANSLITIGSLEFRYPSTTCTATSSFMQVRSTTGANNLGVQHAIYTTAQNASGFVNTTPLTATPTFTNITGIPLNCVQDGHAQFNFFSYTDRTFYRVNVHVADGDSQGFGALGYIFVELQR